MAQLRVVRQEKDFCSLTLACYGHPSKADLNENIFYHPYWYVHVDKICDAQKFEEYTEINMCYNIFMGMDQNKQINSIFVQ